MSGCQSCSGRLFHSVGPAVAKQRSPNWLRDLLTKHVRLSADRRGRRPTAVTSVHLSAGYKSVPNPHRVPSVQPFLRHLLDNPICCFWSHLKVTKILMSPHNSLSRTAHQQHCSVTGTKLQRGLNPITCFGDLLTQCDQLSCQVKSRSPRQFIWQVYWSFIWRCLVFVGFYNCFYNCYTLLMFALLVAGQLTLLR